MIHAAREIVSAYGRGRANENRLVNVIKRLPVAVGLYAAAWIAFLAALLLPAVSIFGQQYSGLATLALCVRTGVAGLAPPTGSAVDWRGAPALLACAVNLPVLLSPLAFVGSATLTQWIWFRILAAVGFSSALGAGAAAALASAQLKAGYFFWLASLLLLVACYSRRRSHE